MDQLDQSAILPIILPLDDTPLLSGDFVHHLEWATRWVVAQ